MSVDTNQASTFDPVRTKADLETLDHEEVVAGYMDYAPGDPEPGANRGRAYWHGWRNAAADHKQIQIDDAMGALAADLYPGKWRKRRASRALHEPEDVKRALAEENEMRTHARRAAIWF